MQQICMAGMAIYGDPLEMCNGIFQGNSQSAPLYVIVTDIVIKAFKKRLNQTPQIHSQLPRTDNWRQYFDLDAEKLNLLIEIIIILIVFIDDTSILSNSTKIAKKMIEIYTENQVSIVWK